MKAHLCTVWERGSISTSCSAVRLRRSGWHVHLPQHLKLKMPIKALPLQTLLTNSTVWKINVLILKLHSLTCTSKSGICYLCSVTLSHLHECSAPQFPYLWKRQNKSVKSKSDIPINFIQLFYHTPINSECWAKVSYYHILHIFFLCFNLFPSTVFHHPAMVRIQDIEVN